MRVVHIAHVPLVPGHPDHGRMVLHPGRWALNLAMAQRRSGQMESSIVTQVPGASADYETEVDGVPVTYLAAPDRLRAASFFYFDARRISRKVRKLRPDIVHAHGTEDAYALAARRCSRPYIISAQGCYFIINREFPPSAISRASIIEKTERFALSRASHVIAKSGYVEKELRNAFPNLKLHRIPNTFDPRLLDIPLDGRRDPFRLAFVGTIVERKGFHVLRKAIEEAVKQNPQLSLDVFGNRADSKGGYEERELLALREILGERLVLHGVIPSLNVAENLSRCRALIAPSLEEMFGNQLVEALVVGTEAIVTEGTAMAENGRSFGNTRIVPVGCERALAGEIEKVMNTPFSLSDALKTRDKVCASFGPDKIADLHADLYRSLIG